MREIPDEMYLCNLDANRTPAALMITYGTAWDAKNVVAAAAALQAILDALKG